MAESGSGLYSLLRLSEVYDFSQYILRSWESRQKFVAEFMRPKPGERILDIGCGTGSIVKHLSDVTYLGVDANPNYIAAARCRYGARATFQVRDVAELDDLPTAGFDLAIALGVMHHLDDRTVSRTLAHVARLLQPSGRLVSHDPVWVTDQSWWSRTFVSFDRGRHVRSDVELIQLLRREFADVEAHIVHNALRIPYSEIILISRGFASRVGPRGDPIT